MDVEIRHAPSFAVARVRLAEGEAVRAEAGALMAMSSGVTVDAKAEGGLAKGLKRSVLGGESLFVNRLTAGVGGGWVDLAARLPGDLTVIAVKSAVNLTRGAWVASSVGLESDTKWAGFVHLTGGEGGYLTRVENRSTEPGSVLVSSYGALDFVDLVAAEQLVLDSGHLVAFDDRVTYETRDISRGLVQTLKSGEGVVFEFTGPGRLWTQTRNPKELVSWLASRGLKRS